MYNEAPGKCAVSVAAKKGVPLQRIDEECTIIRRCSYIYEIT